MAAVEMPGSADDILTFPSEWSETTVLGCPVLQGVRLDVTLRRHDMNLSAPKRLSDADRLS